MTILVTNDDGIYAPGLRALVRAMQRLGNVVVVAPDRQQSAVGHALTVSSPLRATPFQIDDSVIGWSVNGTPADCVKLGITALLEAPPTIVVSGINHGANTSISAIYSGTVSAATEGALMGFPSMAISLDNFNEDADMSAAADVAYSIASKLVSLDLKRGTLLNVNVPSLPGDQLKGIRITRQGESVWHDRYDKRKDPMGRDYYWLTGYLQNIAPTHDADDLSVADGWVTVTPIQHDLTNYTAMDALKEISW